MSILDQYIEKQVNEPFVAQMNQGHKMLCPKCRTFQRHEIAIDTDLSLTLRCRVCGSSDRFVVTKFGYVEEGLRRRLQEFAYQRVVEVLLRRSLKTSQ